MFSDYSHELLFMQFLISPYKCKYRPPFAYEKNTFYEILRSEFEKILYFLDCPLLRGMDLLKGPVFCFNFVWHRGSKFNICSISATITQYDLIFSGRTRRHKLVRLCTSHHSRV